MYNTYMLKNKFISFILFFIFTYSASLIGGMATISNTEPWYSELVKSNYNPPDWVFAPVWTTLYVLMSIAAWRIWIKFYDKKILNIYFIHLFFNLNWSIIFFGFHLIGLALLDLVIILIFIVVLMKLYLTKDKISFYLMTPYFLWSSYALILNFTIFIKN